MVAVRDDSPTAHASGREDRKITKEAFIRNNKGISSEGDLPDEFLAEIYDRIAKSPISLKVVHPPAM